MFAYHIINDYNEIRDFSRWMDRLDVGSEVGFWVFTGAFFALVPLFVAAKHVPKEFTAVRRT